QAFMSAQTPIKRRLYIVAALAAALAFAPVGGPARAQAAVAPFDGSLQRLAEILGALHYLRNICGANAGPEWRGEMQSLGNAEAARGGRRLGVVERFSWGYSGHAEK